MRLSRAVTHFKSNPDSQRRGVFGFPFYLRAAGTLSLARVWAHRNRWLKLSHLFTFTRARVGALKWDKLSHYSPSPAHAWAHLGARPW